MLPASCEANTLLLPVIAVEKILYCYLLAVKQILYCYLLAVEQIRPEVNIFALTDPEAAKMIKSGIIHDITPRVSLLQS